MLAKKEIQIIEPSTKFSLGWKELWTYRELFYYFSWRDVKVKYKQTVLGILWAVIQPVIMMLIFMVFFSKALSISTDGIPAPIFYFSGLLIWNIFNTGVTSAGNSVISNAEILKKIYFPRIILPASGVIVSLFDYAIAFILFVCLLVYYNLVGIEVNYLFYFCSILIALPLTILTTIGLGLLIASMTVKYRDFKYVIPFLLQILFFLSPVIYPTSIVSHPTWKYVLSINPIASAIELSRYPFVNRDIEWELIGISAASAILCLILGVYNFRRTEKFIADLV